MNNGYKNGLWLDKDKIDSSSKIYIPLTCCFITAKEQSYYTRTNVIVIFQGKRLPFKQAWENFGKVPYETARHRYMDLGWRLKEALTQRTQREKQWKN